MDLRSEFAKGVEAFQKKDFSTALNQFQAVLTESPSDPAVYLNLALTYGELKDSTLAAAHLRAAFELAGHTNNYRSVAQTLQSQFSTQQSLLEPSQNFSFLSALHEKVLADLHFWGLCFLSTILIFATLWSALKRKIQHQNELATRRTRSPFALFATLALGFFILTVLKWYDLQVTRATVIAKGTSLLIDANESAPQLTEIPEGQYVLVEENLKDWARIRLEDQGTGYVKSSQIFQRTQK